MQKRFRRDDNGKQYMLIFSDKDRSKSRKEKIQFRKDSSKGKLSIIVVKTKLAITDRTLKHICGKKNIEFQDGKIFTQEEYEIIKSYVVDERSKKLK